MCLPFRPLSTAFLFLAIALLSAIAVRPAVAADKAAQLIAALELKDVVALMQDEGIAYGKDLEAQMFPGKGGESWNDDVKAIYAADRLFPKFSGLFAQSLESGGGNIDAMLSFVQSDLGHKVVTLEISARRAMLDQAVEEAAKVKLAQMQATKDPRLAEVEHFVAVNDLLETNVSGGMNANLAFYRALSEGGGLAQPMTEEEILSEVWSQEQSVRADNEQWLYSFLTLAYAPLTDAELRAYTEFSASKPGKDMNKAMFAAFDNVFVEVSDQLGHAAARHVAGQSL